MKKYVCISIGGANGPLSLKFVERQLGASAAHDHYGDAVILREKSDGGERRFFASTPDLESALSRPVSLGDGLIASMEPIDHDRVEFEGPGVASFHATRGASGLKPDAAGSVPLLPSAWVGLIRRASLGGV